jgi:hypothetical protein
MVFFLPLLGLGAVAAAGLTGAAVGFGVGAVAGFGAAYAFSRPRVWYPFPNQYYGYYNPYYYAPYYASPAFYPRPVYYYSPV